MAIGVESARIAVAIGKRRKVFGLVELVRHWRDMIAAAERPALIIGIVFDQIIGLDVNARIGGPDFDVFRAKIVQQPFSNGMPCA